MLVDLRSDTVTRPTPDMRRAMAEAEVGDDGYGEDPTVNRLEETFAELVGKEAALFVPTGTMANQLALRVHCRPGDAVVAGRRQHVVLYESGAGPMNAGVTFIGVDDVHGWLETSAVREALDGPAYHHPSVGLVALEDTHMAAGGRVWPGGRMAAVAAACRQGSVPVHLDGARLWNAAVAGGGSMADRAAPATTVMCCLSKGLGAPVGSLLAGPEDLIGEARYQRKRMGGTMRQAGVIAAAGLVAMSRVERLAEDHAGARRLAEAVADRWPAGAIDLDAVETNIVVFSPPQASKLVSHLASEGVLAGVVGPGRVRLVTHADVSAADLDAVCRVISGAP